MQHRATQDATCNAVRGAFRFLTAAKRLLLLPSELSDGGVPVFAVFVSEQIVLGICAFCAREFVCGCPERDPCDDSISYRRCRMGGQQVI